MATFKPTLKMASNAKRGLKLRDKFDRGGTEVGVRRARQLADRHELSEADVKSMHSYVARHTVDKQGKAHEWGSNSDLRRLHRLAALGWRRRQGVGRPQRGQPRQIGYY